MTGNVRQTPPEPTCGTLWVTCDNSPTFDGTGPQKAPEGTEDMKSIDKLREWANGLHGVYINQVDHTITVTTGWDATLDMDSVSLCDHVNGILDGIEREVAELRDREYRNGMEDGEMAAERDGWVRLPVDADGVPINVGDVMDEQLPFGGYAAPAPVDTMELSRGAGGYGWMVRLDSESGAFINPKLLRHHHAPTVEDVILDAISRCVGHSPEYWDKPIAECAAKLALRGDE